MKSLYTLHGSYISFKGTHIVEPRWIIGMRAGWVPVGGVGEAGAATITRIEQYQEAPPIAVDHIRGGSFKSNSLGIQAYVHPSHC